jgi:hypothetical protein
LRPEIAQSLDLDKSSRDDHPADPRWDYLLGLGTLSQIVGLEIHPATVGEVKVVISKRKSAEKYLQKHLDGKRRVSRWYWAASGTVAPGFTVTGKSARQLAQNGIRFVGRVLRAIK